MSRTNVGVDSAHFRRTAVSTKKLNINADNVMYRGGIRL